MKCEVRKLNHKGEAETSISSKLRYSDTYLILNQRGF